MSSGPGLPGSPRRLRLPATGAGSCFTKRGRMPAGAAARFMIPSSASASTTATTCCSPAIGRRSPISSGSARSIRSNSRPRRRSRLSISRTASAGRYGRRAVACRGGFFSPSRRVPGTRTARLPRGAAARGGPAPGDTVAAMLDRGHRAVPAAMGAAGRRGAQHLGRAGLGRACSRASSPRRSDAARPRAGRCWRARDYRKASSIPRWITCPATAARFASAAG